MQSIASQPLALSEEERHLLRELLERERTELPAEIHHTRTTDYRQQLYQRRELVDSLLVRLTVTP